MKNTKNKKQTNQTKKNKHQITNQNKKTNPNVKLEETPQKEESWINSEAIAKLAIVFLIIECIGLITASALISQNISEPPFSENVNDPINAIGLFFTILIMTGFIILIIRLKKERKFLVIIETLAIFSTAIIVFASTLNNDTIAILLAILLIVLRNLNREDLKMRNISAGIAIAGAGALLGVSIGMMPAIIFIIVLAIYDIVAVYGTKHMVEMGKAVTQQNFAFTIAIPTKKHKFELGNGDLVIPLLVSTSILANGPFTNNALIAALCMSASFAGLCISIYLVSEKKTAMPALPPQTLLMIIVILAAYFFAL